MEFNPDDNKWFEGEYLNGLKNGKGKEYDKHGKLEFEGEYLNGLKNGKGKEYDKYGLLKFEGEYINGRRKGQGKEYILVNYYLKENIYIIIDLKENYIEKES